MAASPLLVDSSYYIRCLREGRDPLRELTMPAIASDLVVCGVVRCEVGRGLRNPHVRRRFQAVWDVMINVPTDNRLWAEAENILWELDRRGINLPLPDVVIACCAMRAGAVVLTYDHHFQLIPDVRVTDHIDY